jgi:sec-independent protein translocase protein TatC
MHANEKKYLLVILPSSLILFFAGIGFSYWLVLGVALKFLVMTAGEGFIPMLGAAKYLAFVISLLLPFGIIFQLPLITLFLTHIGLITPKIMVGKRKYAIIFIFVIAAVLTPTPDILTQTLMTLPMILLYELSILISRLVLRKKKVHSIVIK